LKRANLRREWLTIPKSRAVPNKAAAFHNQQPLHPVAAFWFMPLRSPLFELARVLVRLGHVARFIVNTNHGVV
jgi:hypothetical protein